MTKNRVFFISPDINTPTGGVKQLYRQVDILNENGIDAYILHQKLGFRCTWFTNETQVVYSDKILDDLNSLIDSKTLYKVGIIRKLKSLIKKMFKTAHRFLVRKKNDIVLNSDDVFVFPEVYVKKIRNMLPNHKKVIYNQNCYYTFVGCDYLEKSLAYSDENVVAIIVASTEAVDYIKFCFREKPLFRVKYGIDEEVFYYSSKKKRQIAFMPRKLKEDVIQITNILNFLKRLEGWTLKIIDKLNEEEVAQALRESVFFLSFNHREGFGMPPAEAMACGCVVIGYTGKGGKEFFKEDFCYPIEDRDVLSYVRTLDNVMKEFEVDNKPFIEKGKKASEFILSEYSMEIESRSIVQCWNNILNG
jgi:glycosyltransferase involved in cell wall biosynthesis